MSCQKRHVISLPSEGSHLHIALSPGEPPVYEEYLFTCPQILLTVRTCYLQQLLPVSMERWYSLFLRKEKYWPTLPVFLYREGVTYLIGEFREETDYSPLGAFWSFFSYSKSVFSTSMHKPAGPVCPCVAEPVIVPNAPGSGQVSLSN